MGWEVGEKRALKRLSTPLRIQEFLNSIPYNIEPITRSARGVLQARRAHCFDGALFAAAVLELQGEKPLVVDMRSSSDDDDHVIAVFKRNGRWGALAKSNYVTCRYRDPVYRDIRELVMSYFDGYFNLAGKKTLREYCDPYDLTSVRTIDWRWSPGDVDELGFRIDRIKHYKLLTKAHLKLLAPPDDLSFRGATLGLDARGAHQVKNQRRV